MTDSRQHVTWNSSEAVPLTDGPGACPRRPKESRPLTWVAFERAAGMDCAHAMVHDETHLRVALVGATPSLLVPVRTHVEDCTGWGSGHGVPVAVAPLQDGLLWWKS